MAVETVAPKRWPWRRWSTPGAVLLIVTLVLLLAVLTRRVGDPDFWWHLRVAQWMIDNHALPSHDLFTYTVPGHSWVDHEYLTELIMYALWRAGGLAAVSVAFALITWAGFLLILCRIRLASVPSCIAGAGLGIAALAGVAVWGPRSQMITFTFTCLELYWIEAYLRNRSRAIYALPAVVVIWANLHAGFVFSLLFLAVAVVCELFLEWGTRDGQHRLRAGHLGVVLGACALGGLLTPHGIDLYVYVARTQFSSVQQSFIAEWHAPDFHRLDTRGLELLIILLGAGFALRRPRLWDVALSMAALILALQAVRHAAIFVAAVAPTVAWSFADAWARAAIHRPRFLAARRGNWRVARLGLLAVASVSSTLFVGNTLRGQKSSTGANFPVGAANWLAAHPQTGSRMFNAYDWGGYLLNRFYPSENRRVFSYGEAVVMGDPLLKQISDIETAQPDWQDILTEHGVDYVVERPDSSLAMALSVDNRWRLAYSDGFAVVFVRR